MSGGRLLRRLEQDGVSVRCLCRDPEALRWRVQPSTEVVQGDLLQPESLGAVFSGIDTAFYLVHSMHAGAVSKRRSSDAAATLRERLPTQVCVALFTLAGSRTAVNSRRTCVAVQPPEKFSDPPAFR